MIAVDQQAPIRQQVADVVPEMVVLRLEIVGPQQGLMGDCAERDDDLELRHGTQFIL